MPTLLAIETSTELASVALLVRGKVIYREASGAQTHSQTVLPMIRELLAEAGIAMSACDAIAFGCGPGSFTGVRTACGVAQGLAYGADIGVVPVVTLEAMAHACRAATGALDVCAVLDARMGEVYWAQYRYQNGWHAVTPPSLCRPAEASSRISPTGMLVACGNGFSAYDVAFASVLPSLAEVRAEIMPHAVFVAELAALVPGAVLPAHEARPLYLRDKVARTIIEREQQVTT
jgi:tRNA threonylcarbamoyladenosine biosynthesis protein TsaB